MLYLLLLFAATALAEDARTLVERSVAVTSLDSALEREYTYKEHTQRREPRPMNMVREVLYIGGKRVAYTVERDGKPLPERDARREQQKLDKAVAEASRLTPAERAKREAEAKKSRDEDREMLKLIPQAYDLTVLGEETLNGRPAWKVGCTPRSGYRGKHDGFLRKMRGTLWIDKQDYHWARVEADTLDTISWGLILARIAPGTRLVLELRRVNDEVWLPGRFEISGAARVALVRKANFEQVISFSDYRRYRTDSRITSASPLTQ